MINKGEALGKAHWEYIGALLKVHGEDEKIIKKIEFHYIQAAKHFFGHGYEVCKKEYDYEKERKKTKSN